MSGIAVTFLVAPFSYKRLIYAYYAQIMLKASLLCRHYAQCFSKSIMPKIMLA